MLGVAALLSPTSALPVRGRTWTVGRARSQKNRPARVACRLAVQTGPGRFPSGNVVDVSWGAYFRDLRPHAALERLPHALVDCHLPKEPCRMRRLVDDPFDRPRGACTASRFDLGPSRRADPAAALGEESRLAVAKARCREGLFVTPVEELRARARRPPARLPAEPQPFESSASPVLAPPSGVPVVRVRDEGDLRFARDHLPPGFDGGFQGRGDAVEVEPGSFDVD